MYFASVICLVITLGQAQQPAIVEENSSITEKYTAKPLYRMEIPVDPTSIQIVEDPRYSTEMIPVYEMVYMAHSPRSEIRRIPELIEKLRFPQLWAQYTDIVADLTTIKYPNTMGLLPPDTVKAKSKYIWWIASGYVGAKSGFPSNTGGVFLIDMSQDRWVPVPLVNSTGRGFTHVEWMDMDLDGHVDLVTIVGSNNMNELLWYRQPEDQSPWKMHRISKAGFNVGGTDFKVMKLPRDGEEGLANVFIVSGRTSGRLLAFWVDDPSNDWTRESNIMWEVIASDGAYVNVEIVDLNIDGRKEILTSVSAVAGRKGQVIAYEYPKTGIGSGGKWRKHILSEWAAAKTNYQTMSPGPAFTFQIQSGTRRNVKPHIMVSGMDDNRVYVLSPKTWSPFIWSYEKTTIFTSTGPVGVPAVRDIDGDGINEIFIPSSFSINVMTYIKGSSLKLLPHAMLVVSVTIVSIIMT